MFPVACFAGWLVATLFARGGLRAEPRTPQNSRTAKDIHTRTADELLARMTLEEKIGQMVLFTHPKQLTGPNTPDRKLEERIRQGQCGNVFNAFTVASIRQYQSIAVEETRLGIPLLFGYDVIHGHKTVFPISLGEAASWDLTAIEQAARVAAIEASACGINWTFAPMVDIARDPRWGRISEGAGEDPHLSSEIARARVRGFQGKDLSDPSTVLSCVKHFAAYGAAQAGRDYHTVDISVRTLREVHLPPFKAALEEGALSVMTAFNELNGIPATANRFLLKDILRKEWGFDGFVVTDYTSINELIPHGAAANESEAGALAMTAGVDMDMQGSVYLDHLKQLLTDGKVSQRQIDDAVRNILRLKSMLGLFDDPYRYCDSQREAELSFAPKHLEAAYDMACKSLVLLKNDRRALPLEPHAKIAVIGPLADSQRDLLGSWKAEGDWDFAETVLDGIKRNNVGGSVSFAKGCGIDSLDKSGFAEAIAAATESDVVVMVLGESWDMSGEAACRTNINLPGVQTELLLEIERTGKPVVLVLINGRPLALEKEAAAADAILEAWFPGVEGGKAVADTLFGKRNPSGRLPVTFPRNLGQVPIYYNAKNTGRPIDLAKPREKYKSNYLDVGNDPLYPFGFGTSYTTFSYSAPQLSHKIIGPDEQLSVVVTVTNTGDRDGAEVVQLYIRDLVGSVTRPVKELKAFEKIQLAVGESRKVTFVVGESALRFLRRDMTWGTEPGDFEVFVGPNSRDLQSASFTVGQ